MKSIYIICITGLFLLSGISQAQQVGFTFDGMAARGEGLNGRSMPAHAGFSYGFLFSPKKTPFSFGYRNAMNLYSFTTRDELPFYREDYVHDVANVTNSNTISQHVLFTRIEINKNGGISPFIEAGAGYARYKSKWSAVDPYENSNDNCEGYLDQGTYFKTGTFIANASAGVNFKFDKLGNRKNCSGVWLTLAVDYSVGGKVNYLNSKMNATHFYYDQGSFVLTGNPRSPVSSHNHGNSIMPGGCYDDFQNSYYEKHELMQLRIGFTLVVGNCK
jgi:hypothetical protein